MSKKLVQINVTCNGSTGRIMEQIQKEAISQEWEAYSFFGRGKPSNKFCYKIGNMFDVFFHVFITRILNLHGHASKIATKRMIKKIKEIDPDVIQLHNIHGYYLNIKILFEYLKKCNKKVVWTLHDCWAFTGHCSYFTMAGCDKWQNGCNKCIQKKEYPKALLFDTSKTEYNLKKELFTGIKDMTIITPSNWLANLVKKSFLNNYTVQVIHNGIDTEIFKPTYSIDVCKKYDIPKEKDIILGVAAIWDKRKGLNEFVELAKVIDEDKIIVLVGLNKKQIKKLPNNIIGIERTENTEELSCLYTAASVLFNPSKEETFSLVTAEATACGTPVIAYDNSAVAELINKKNGITMHFNAENNEKKVLKNIKCVQKLKRREKEFCINKMVGRYFVTYGK